MLRFEFTAEENGARPRLDAFLTARMEAFTRSRIKKLIEEGAVTVGGAVTTSPAYAVRDGDRVEVSVPETAPARAVAQDIPFEIVYEDEDLAVIDKPQGLTVHPSETEADGTLVNGLLYRLTALSGINGELRPGIVHRIDKNTSGLLVVAKNDAAHLSLQRQIEEKACYRIYRAVVEGVVKEDSGTIDAPIGRSKSDRKKMAVVSDGRRAVTHYTVLQRFPAHTYVEFRLETGRTHQIRVHAKHIGHPVVGDPVYGYIKQKFVLNGQLLHAYRLSFVHPRTGERVEFTAPLPDYFEKVLKVLENALQRP